LALQVLALTLIGALGESYPSSPNDRMADGQPISPAPAAAYLLIVLAAGALAFRRRYQIAALVGSLLAALIWTGLGYPNGAMVMVPMVALYTVVAASGRVRDGLILGGVTAGLIVGTGAIWGPFGTLGGGQTVTPFVVAAVVALGLAVANRRAYVAELNDRAAEETQRRVDLERLRIARELHDVVAHTMATINVQAGVAAHVLADRPEQAAQALQVIKSSSKQGLRELRSILTVLRAVDADEPTAPTPGLSQLDSLVGNTERAGLPTTVRITGRPVSVPAAADLAAYRIVQESLTNALRHAGQATATVLLDYGDDRLTIDIADTGTGSDAPPAEGSGHGLIGMRERAGALGGTLHAGPDPSGGYRVHACLPLAENT
jgi:signal transduction histidine kinase